MRTVPPMATDALDARSPAQERRLRKRRSEARIRLRLAADRALVDSHHASAAPGYAGPCASTRIVQLLEALLAQQGALFGCIAGLSGWHAGMQHEQTSFDGNEGPRAGSPPDAAGDLSGVRPFSADATCFVPWSLSSQEIGIQTKSSDPTVSSGTSGPSPSTVVDFSLETRNDIPSSPILGAGSILVDVSGSPPIVHDPSPSPDFTVVGIRRGAVGLPAGQGEAVLTDDLHAPCTFQQFMRTDHWDFFRRVITDDRLRYVESFRSTGFPADWTVLDIFAHVVALDIGNTSPYADFSVVEFYMLIYLRGQCPYVDHESLEHAGLTINQVEDSIIDQTINRVAGGLD